MAKNNARVMPQTEQPQPDQMRTFTRAEISRLKDKADTANKAIADYEDWLSFLRQQHEAEDPEQWLLGQAGFVRKPESVSNNGAEHAEDPARARVVPVAEVEGEAV